MNKRRVRILKLDGGEIVRDVTKVETQGQSVFLFDEAPKQSALDVVEKERVVAVYWNVIGFELEDIEDARSN